MIHTDIDKLEAAVFTAMQTEFSNAGELQIALGISQSSARNYFNGLVKNISKENLFEIADKLNIPYCISNQG